MMDLKFKKLVLLAMKMNNANHSVLRASPRKIIDLQLYNNVFINDCINTIRNQKIIYNRPPKCFIVYYVII